MKAWTARDRNGILILSKYRPIKEGNYFVEKFLFYIKDSDLPEGINPKWKDDEPIEVKLKIEKV